MTTLSSYGNSKSAIIPQFVTIYDLAIGKEVKQVPEQTSCGLQIEHDVDP